MTEPLDQISGLDAEKRRLVEDNIGLVYTHLRRAAAGSRQPRRNCEWEDLFQEGCIGLVRAAIEFRPELGVPFAGYALPKIHGAVSEALRQRFSTINAPRRRRNNNEPTPAGKENDGVPQYAGTLPPHLAARNPQPPPPRSGDTIGSMVRRKYERTVQVAARTIGKRASKRGDRDLLIQALVEQRLLVPEPQRKSPIRRIARETSSSFARVSTCEKQLENAIRRQLTADPEFITLDLALRKSQRGGTEPIDRELDAKLQRIAADEFICRFRMADTCKRGQMLERLLTLSRTDAEPYIRELFAHLSSRDRESIMAQANGNEQRQGVHDSQAVTA